MSLTEPDYLTTALTKINIPGTTSDVRAGIHRLLFDYAELDSGDVVVVAYTPEVRLPTAWVCFALEQLGFEYSSVPMKPLSDRGLADRLRAKLPTPTDVSKCVLLVFEWDTMSHNQIFREAFHPFSPDQRRIVRCINAGADMFAIGLKPHPFEVSRKNADLLHFLGEEGSIQIQSDAGTNLRVKLDSSRYDWISNRGISELGRMIVLPPAEIATFPVSISGVFVADFAINVNHRFDGDVRLDTSPVRMTIEEGELIDFDCEDHRISRQLREFFAMQNARKVGELGFGTHPHLTAAVPDNSHLNERRAGVHLGFGQHNQEDDVAGYIAKIHVDLIAAGGKVTLSNGEAIDLCNVPQTNAEHPVLMKSVDLFSPDIVPPDCCGIS